MPKVLITGGAGFIGSHIAQAFADAAPLVIDNLSSGSLKNLPAQAQLQQLDIRSSEARELVSAYRPDVIVHAAAQISVRESMRDPAFDTAVNVGGLVNLLQGINSPKTTQFVFISTGGAIYGEQDRYPADESHRKNPTSVYGLAKWVGEQYLDLWKRSYGLKVSCLRLANVYGPRQNPHGEAGVVAIFMQRLLAGEVPRINGDGKQTRDYVYVGDVAKAVEMVVSGGVEGTFNIGTGVETSVNELYREIAAVLESNVAPQHGPAQPGEQLRSVIDAALAQRTFGWRASVAIREGLAKTGKWFKEHRLR
jgi:UDP-glucose 4-epimerase